MTTVGNAGVLGRGEIGRVELEPGIATTSLALAGFHSSMAGCVPEQNTF